jgi:hypothetical protein
MASGGYNNGSTRFTDGTSPFLTTTLKCLLVATAVPYTFNPDDDVLDAGGANDIHDAETTVTGYTGGFAGAGRKTLASKTVAVNDANNRTEFDCADVTWTALGAGQTLEAAVVAHEVTNDTLSVPLIYLDPSNIPTNGGDITLQFASNGIYNLNN